MVLDKFTERLMENVLSSCMPRLQEMLSGRIDELERVKARVRSNPDEVEAWFDREIAKARDLDVCGLLEKIQK